MVYAATSVVGTMKHDTESLVRHVILNSILRARTKHNRPKIIIACDSRKYWRKEQFKYYKGHRKHQKYAFDKEVLYKILNNIIVDLRENFKYDVITVEGAEADDVIAVLTKHLSSHANITIGSSDNDFIQLQKYPNVKQWNTTTQGYVEHSNPVESLIEKICLGDAGDNIPSICNGEEWAKARAENNPTRAAPFKKSRLEEFYKYGKDACKTDDEKRNYERNELLISFDSIPEELENKILEEYNREINRTKASMTKLMTYLVKHKMKTLLNSIGDF